MSVTLGNRCLIDCDLIIVANCTASFRFDWTRTDYDGTESPVNLEDATALCQIRIENDGDIIADLSRYVVFDDGVVQLDVPAAATETMPEGKYVWDIIITESSGEVTRLAAGRVNVIDPISEGE